MKEEKTLLELLAEKDTDWIKMVRSFGKHYAISMDVSRMIVSEMYIKLNKYVKTPERIMFNDTDINTMFVYITLKNLYINYSNKETTRRKNTYNNLDELNHLVDDEYDTELAYKYMEFDKKILDEINGWHHYDSKLFKIVYYDRVPMRKLSRDTKISMSSIYNTIKICRGKLKDKFGEEYTQINK